MILSRLQDKFSDLNRFFITCHEVKSMNFRIILQSSSKNDMPTSPSYILKTKGFIFLDIIGNNDGFEFLIMFFYGGC